MTANHSLEQVTPAQASSSRHRGQMPLRGPSPAALQTAQEVAVRAKGRSAPVRRLFLERTDTSAPTTPLALMLRGGRGGGVRLKLYLSFLWLAAAPPHELRYPARAWAQLLDLEDPETKGARRIADATRWLDEHDFIELSTIPGYSSTVQLLNEAGTGTAYELPGSAYNRLRESNPKAAAAHRYIQLPASLWTSGWVAVLSPAALSMLLVLRVHAGANPSEDVWISPGYAKDTYLLSEETRTRGLRELAQVGLISITRRQLVSSDSFDFRRFRNLYQFKPERLEQRASGAEGATAAPQPLHELARSVPTAAVIQTYNDVQDQLRLALLAQGSGANIAKATARQLLAQVTSSELLPEDDLADLTELIDVRNRIVHGRATSLTTAEALDYIEKATELLTRIASTTSGIK